MEVDPAEDGSPAAAIVHNRRPGKNLRPSGTEAAGRPFADSVILLQEADMGRGILLWLLGIPIPVIILILLLFR
ncbi:hypothetical protein QFZ27_003152 [Inquilinus ginsengisoli]|uniref:hypothetical protein n=1 Tax=Inquilinus ginsengisoli TaxID=363840 RepID=UPI003D1A53E3